MKDTEFDMRTEKCTDFNDPARAHLDRVIAEFRKNATRHEWGALIVSGWAGSKFRLTVSIEEL